MKNVLITGGSRGIGKECVHLFAEKGYRVFLNYNKSVTEAEKISEKTGAIPVKCDVSNEEEVRKMYTFIHDNYGNIDVLVNNAGIAQIKLFTDISEKDWDNVFDVNVKGMFFVTKAFVKDMISRKKGKIINISSVWGVTGGSCEVHYSASKAAVIGFTKALAKELGLSGITVNCVAPGVVDTDMNKNLTAEDIDALKNEIPLGRIGTPKDVAKVILFLASEKADYITGQVIGTDGGMIM